MLVVIDLPLQTKENIRFDLTEKRVDPTCVQIRRSPDKATQGCQGHLGCGHTDPAAGPTQMSCCRDKSSP